MAGALRFVSRTQDCRSGRRFRQPSALRGPGSTLIAAETVGRVCLAMEIDPRYCDVIVERWQRFTGGKAVLDGGDRSFEDMKTVRAAA